MHILEDNHLGSRIRLRAAGGTVSVESLPAGMARARVMVKIGDSAQRECFKESYPAGRHICCTPALAAGEYSLWIYLNPPGEDLYYSVFSSANGVPLLSDGRSLSFRASPYNLANRRFVESLPTSRSFLSECLEDDPDIQCRDGAIRNLARTLSRGSLFPQSTIIKAYDWVAGNIAYDVDSLAGNRYLYDNDSALCVLMKRRGICVGYHNLLSALLRASGIPTLGIECFSLGSDTEGWWYWGDNMDDGGNHIMTAAYAGQRWHIMDVTWGSNLRYEHGQRRSTNGFGPSRSFCDSTIPFISLSHRFDDYQP